MKTAANDFSATHSELTPPQPAQRLHVTRYLLVAVIIAAVGLLATLMPEDPSGMSFQIGPGFLLFWLAGGCVTLILLRRAARKPK